MFFVFSLLTLLMYFFVPDIDTLTTGIDTPSETSEVTSVLKETSPTNGSLEVFFCPHERCEDALIDFLSRANASIHCAFYELNLENLSAFLINKAQQIDVQIVVDEDNEGDFNTSFTTVNTNYALMHNKFCSVDGRYVSTGSMNPTKRDAYTNNNNLILLESSTLAKNYEDEFHEVQNQSKKGNTSTTNHVQIGDLAVENYFCPEDHCADQAIEELRAAQHSIHFTTFSFTHDGIATMLAKKHSEGVTIKGVMEATQVTQYSVFEFLTFQNITVLKDANKGNLHHKVFIIDNQTIVTGSFNPTANGDERNDENVLIIHDAAIAAEFLEEFEYVFAAAQAKLANSTAAP